MRACFATLFFPTCYFSLCWLALIFVVCKRVGRHRVKAGLQSRFGSRLFNSIQSKTKDKKKKKKKERPFSNLHKSTTAAQACYFIIGTVTSNFFPISTPLLTLWGSCINNYYHPLNLDLHDDPLSPATWPLRCVDSCTPAASRLVYLIFKWQHSKGECMAQFSRCGLGPAHGEGKKEGLDCLIGRLSRPLDSFFARSIFPFTRNGRAWGKQGRRLGA